MPRQRRIEYEGAMYHVMNRGDHGEVIFLDDEDRRKFLITLGQACIKASWQVHAYCLMNNHFHLVIETPKPTLVAGMKWLLGVYTQRFNVRHKKRGHLFAGRYKSLLIDESDRSYLRTVCDYVHLNPARAHLLGQGEPLEGYLWSSFPHYLQRSCQRWPWLRVDRLLGEHGIENDNAYGRREFSKIMNLRCSSKEKPDETVYEMIRCGWMLGSQYFLEYLEQKITSTPDKKIHIASECNDTMEVFGRRLIQEKLQELNMCFEDLDLLSKAAPLKTELAEILRRRTTLSLEWIARELRAGVRKTLANALYQKARNSKINDA